MTDPLNSYDRPRQALINAISNSSPPRTLKQLSLACGRNHAYLQQYIERRSPLHLPEDIRHKLAAMLGISQETLMSAELEDEISKQFQKGKSDSMANIAFLDHPQHAGLKLQSWKMSHHMLNHLGYKNLSTLTLVQIGDDAANAMIAMGNFAIIDTSDNSALHAGCFAIDAGDHIKLRFLEQPDAKIDMIYVRHSSHDQEGFTLTASSLNIIGRAIWKLCLI